MERKIVIGLMYRREAFRTSRLTAYLKDLVSGETQQETIGLGAWTNRRPDRLPALCKALEEVLKQKGHPLNREGVFGSHRCKVWVKKKAFQSFEQALEWIKGIRKEAYALMEQKELEELERELEV